MKKRFASAAALVAAALLIAACGSSSTTSGSGSGPITVGAPTDESGTYSLIANIWVKGQTAAAAYLNAHGGIMGRKLVIQRQDTQSNPNEASQDVTQMIQSGKVAAILPADPGTESGPVYEAMTRSRFLSVGPGSLPNTADPKVYPYAFESAASPTELASASACEAPTLGYKRIAILAMNDSYSQTEVKEYEKKFKQLGITITGNQEMAYTDTSATAQLQKLEGTHPQALMVVAYGSPVGVIFSGLKSIGWDPPFLGDLSVATFPLSTVAKAGTYPSKVYGLGTASSTRLTSGFTALQKQAIGELKSAAHVTTFTAALDAYDYGYDAVMLYAAGVEKAKTTEQSKVISALESMQSDPTQTNVVNQPEPQVSASHHGLQNGKYWLVNMKSSYQDGTWQEIKPIKSC